MKPKDQLIKEIKELKAKWDKNFREKGSTQPGGGIDNKRDREQFRFGYEPAYKYAFEEITELINTFLKGYKLVKEGDLIDKEELKILEAHLMEGAEEYIPSILRKLKKTTKEKGKVKEEGE